MSQDRKKNLPEMPSFDANAIRELASLLTETGLTEIEIEAQGTRVRIARGGAVQTFAPTAPTSAAPPQAAQPVPTTGSDLAQHPGAVTSPMVGTIYLAPEPGSAPFVQEGDTVSQGQTLLIVEAMKTMNPIPAPKAGRVKQVLVSNEEPVEYGQPLLILE